MTYFASSKKVSFLLTNSMIKKAIPFCFKTPFRCSICWGGIFANGLINKCGGKVPHNKEELISLPGVGNKTANCVLAELYNEPYLAVDTHMQRFSRRLGIAKVSDSVENIEKKFLKFIPQERLIKTNHQIIWFGRYKCKAISPDCENCKLQGFCKK